MVLVLVLSIVALYLLGIYSTYQYLQMLSEMEPESQMSKAAIVTGAIMWPKTSLFMFWNFEIHRDKS